MLRRGRWLRSSVDELIVIGSRWSRLVANPVSRRGAPTAASPPAPTPTPFVTLIPTLHVASTAFYDTVLEYMVQSVRERPNVVILLEGVCDSEEGEVLQMQEYFEISRNEALKTSMLAKADSNTLYDDVTLRAMCEELCVKYDALMRARETVRLQECYLKPKMAALVGEYLRNDADLNMTEVEAILLEHEEHTGGASIAQLGSHPAVRKNRESKVAKAAQLRCVEWMHRGCAGEVIVPWGFYHTRGIKHSVMELNAQHKTGDAEEVLFVEDTKPVRCVPFGITKELLT